MHDCEAYGFKHKLYISDFVDQFLWGYVEFKCHNCRAMVRVDRLYFYIALRTPAERRLNGS